MSTTTIYIIVAISLLHFVVAIVFLLRKLGGPSELKHLPKSKHPRIHESDST